MDGETPALCLRMYPGFLLVDRELGLLPSNWENFFTLLATFKSFNRNVGNTATDREKPLVGRAARFIGCPLEIFGVVNTVG